MHSVQVTTTRPKRRDYKCKCVTQSSKAVWIDKGWTYNGRVLLGSFRVLMYNGRALLGPLRVLIYSGRVPSGPRLDWSGPTPRLGFTKILQSGRGVGGTLNTRAGCGRYLLETLAVKHSSGLWEVPSRDSSSGSNIVVQTLLQTG